MSADTPVLERASTETSSRNAGVKTILLHVQDDDGLNARLEAALAIARASSAHLTCLHVTPIEAYVAFDSFGGIFVMDDVIDALTKSEHRLRDRIEGELANEDVPWDYVEVTGNVVAQIAKHGCLADLIVTGREPHKSDFVGPAVGVLGDLLQMSRTPLLVAAAERPMDPTGVALVAWDGSLEAANAVRSSLGLLRMARDVRVLTIEEDRTSASFPGAQLLRYLSRHGIHAELVTDAATGKGADAQEVAGRLLAYARAIDAGFVVMGGYSHSRVGEYIFGGVTRTMLTAANVPLVINR